MDKTSIERLLISLSKVDSDNTDNFICSCLVFLLQLNGHSTKQYGTEFANWNKGSLIFAKAFAIGRVYVQSANLYLNGKFDEDQAQVLGKAIKDKVKDFEKDVSISREQLR